MFHGRFHSFHGLAAGLFDQTQVGQYFWNFVFFFAFARQPVLIISGKLDDLSELTGCASAGGNQLKWTIGRFEKSETMMLAWTTINRGLSASVRTSISQMQPMAGTMTHGGREPEKCIICFITYFLTCTLRKHINKTQIDNGVGRLSIWRLCPLALGFPSIRCKNTMKIQKNTNNKSYY